MHRYYCITNFFSAQQNSRSGMAEIESVLVDVLEILVQFGVAYVKSMQHCCQQPMYLNSSCEHALHVAHTQERLEAGRQHRRASLFHCTRVITPSSGEKHCICRNLRYAYPLLSKRGTRHTVVLVLFPLPGWL